MGMVDAVFVHTYVWPVLKIVLTDQINLVREDAIWAIPILLKCFCAENVVGDVEGGDTAKAKELWSNAACQEVVAWMKEAILKLSSTNTTKTGKSGSNGKGGNFSQRQLYCQICAAVALAIRFGDGLNDPEDPIVELESKFTSALNTKDPQTSIEEYGPYRKMTKAERLHLLRLLSNDILPVALEFKDDRVTNVRLTLRKALQLMPDDMSQIPAFKETLRLLEEEVETWESFNGMQEPIVAVAIPLMKGKAPDLNGAPVARGGDDVRDTGKVSHERERKLHKSKSKKKDKKKGGHENQQVQGNTALGQGEASMMASI
jgi:serine/threonine-protein phosphatase 4 regulatory subunit 1